MKYEMYSRRLLCKPNQLCWGELYFEVQEKGAEHASVSKFNDENTSLPRLHSHTCSSCKNYSTFTHRSCATSSLLLIHSANSTWLA